MGKPKYPLVFIEWSDSYGVSPVWEEIDDDLTLPEHCCYSIGFLVKETRKSIIIVPHLSPANKKLASVEQGCGDMTIPVSAIRKRFYIMPAKTRKQQKFMAMCANPKSRKKAEGKCPPVKVAKKFRKLKK